MNQQEQARIQVLNNVLEYQLPTAQAAEIMGVSERHTKRLLAAYRKHGAAALAHGNRGRRPHNAVPEAAVAAVVKLASNGYAGANHTHLTELLRERESIDLSRPTVRRILTKAGIGSPRSRRSQQHRFRRRRMPQEGMLVQIDGSNHPWLEDRGPKLTLLIAVDDATGTVAQAVFRTTEDTRGYLLLLEGLIRQWGIPLALYSDRHAALKYNASQKAVPVETTHQQGNRALFRQLCRLVRSSLHCRFAGAAFSFFLPFPVISRHSGLAAGTSLTRRDGRRVVFAQRYWHRTHPREVAPGLARGK